MYKVKEWLWFFITHPKLWNYYVETQMPQGSSCMKDDVDSVAQAWIDPKHRRFIMIPDYCMRTDKPTIYVEDWE